MDNIKTWLIPLLEEHGCELYELEWEPSKKPAILRVVIDKPDGVVDLDTCAECSDAISARLDETDDIDREYMLEVCSPGAERELKNDQQIAASVGKYIHAALKNPQEGFNEVTGTLADFQDGVLVIQFFVKGRPKKLAVARDNLASIRSAVKI